MKIAIEHDDNCPQRGKCWCGADHAFSIWESDPDPANQDLGDRLLAAIGSNLMRYRGVDHYLKTLDGPSNPEWGKLARIIADSMQSQVAHLVIPGMTRGFFVKAGSKGGRKAASRMTPQQRKKRARKAAKARYAKSGGAQ